MKSGVHPVLTKKEARSLTARMARATKQLRKALTSGAAAQCAHLDKMVYTLFDVEERAQSVLVRIKRSLHQVRHD
jgi:hypothetical protein